jgi:tRNA(Ile)-lysidine synthase
MRVQQDVRDRHLIRSGERILVAVSGGQDSLCLMQILHDLARRWQWRLAVLHCDHRWHASETDCAAAVSRWVEALGWPCGVATANTVTLDEDGARRWRYRMLAEQAERWQCDVVATAHTGSDRAETVLYNLIRGTGLQGLGSLDWSRPLAHDAERSPRLVRPLLGVWRHETGSFCQQHQLPVWEDRFNQDVSHPRNRLRLEVIPHLKEHLNPQVEVALNRTATLLADDAAYLDSATASLWERIYRPHPPRLLRQVLSQSPVSLQRRVIRAFLCQHLPRSPSFERVETLRHLVQAPQGSRTAPYPGGLWGEVRDDCIVLRNERERSE